MAMITRDCIVMFMYFIVIFTCYLNQAAKSHAVKSLDDLHHFRVIYLISPCFIHHGPGVIL